MAKRLTSRLSAGAALVTGLGMVGIAAATPAQAATDLVYTCQTPLNDAAPFQVSIDTDAPETVAAGETLSISSITGTVTLDTGTSNAAAGFLGIETLEGSTPAESVVTKSGAEQTGTVSTELATAPTTFWDSEAGTWTQEGIDPANPEIVLPLAGSGGSIDVPADATGTYELHAPESFTSSFIGTTGDGTEIPLEIPCTYESGNTVIDTVTVTEPEPTEPEPTEPEPTEPEPTEPEPTEPEPTFEVDDWFDEPWSMPLVDNVFTVEGTATHAGTLIVEILAGTTNAEGEQAPGEVLKTYTWNVTEGENSRDFSLVEGADWVRLVSQDCVDAAGDDETVEGSGCNQVYQAPWVENPDDGAGDDSGTEDGDQGGQDAGDGDDAGTADPEVPEVVQTDGLTPAMMPQEDNTAALALGGLLLAGAGAGTVLVARRRTAQR